MGLLQIITAPYDLLVRSAFHQPFRQADIAGSNGVLGPTAKVFNGDRT
jgi:hypothetical protein